MYNQSTSRGIDETNNTRIQLKMIIICSLSSDSESSGGGERASRVGLQKQRKGNSEEGGNQVSVFESSPQTELLSTTFLHRRLYPSCRIDIFHLDLSSVASVRNFVSEVILNTKCT